LINPLNYDLAFPYAIPVLILHPIDILSLGDKLYQALVSVSCLMKPGSVLEMTFKGNPQLPGRSKLLRNLVFDRLFHLIS
jgi:hypothetical protein